MSFLVDSNVLSEPTRPRPSEKVTAWLVRNERKLVVDPVILGELRFGVLLIPRGRRRDQLEEWFSSVVRTVRCLPWDAACGLEWAELLGRLRHSGRPMQIKDSMIAATALVHGLTVATRNVADFESTGVAIVNPFDG